MYTHERVTCLLVLHVVLVLVVFIAAQHCTSHITLLAISNDDLFLGFSSCCASSGSHHSLSYHSLSQHCTIVRQNPRIPLNQHRQNIQYSILIFNMKDKGAQDCFAFPKPLESKVTIHHHEIKISIGVFCTVQEVR